MTIHELLRSFSSGEGALAVAVVLAVVLWAMRRSGLVENMATKHELAAILPTALAYVIAGLQSGQDLKQVLLSAALVLIGPMKWNSAPLPARGSKSKPPSNPPTAASLLLIAALALPGCSQLLPAMVQLGNTSKLLSSYLGLIADSADMWAEANPDDLTSAQKLRGAMERAQRALVALERIGAGADAYQDGDVAAAKQELLDAYTALYQIAQEMGIVPGGAPSLTSYSARRAGAAQPVRQVEAISPSELEVLLR